MIIKKNLQFYLTITRAYSKQKIKKRILLKISALNFVNLIIFIWQYKTIKIRVSNYTSYLINIKPTLNTSKLTLYF